MSKVFKKLSIVVLAVAMMVTVVAPAGAATTEELQAQIAALMAQINALNSQLSGTPATTMTSYTFTRNLTVGSTGADVMELQKFLVSGGYLVLATPTNYFGGLTKAALAKYQAANGISPAVGYFGAITRGRVNAMAATPATPATPAVPGVTPATPATPAVTGFTASLASDTPVAAVVASNTAFNPVLKVSLQAASADVKVTSITVRKSGLVANSNITGVDIIDSMGVRHGNVITSLTAENDAIVSMSSDPIVVKAGTTEKVTIRFNNAATSGTAQFGIVSASAIVADSTVNGTFPIMGNTMTLQDGSSSVASTTIAVRPVNATGANLNVDAASAQEITKFQIVESSSKEAIKVAKLTLYNYGNASDTDYKDVELVAQDGTLLATAQPKGQYVTFDLSATPYVIEKGLTKDFTVRAKIVNGATRTIQLAVYNNYDLVVIGASTGASVLATATGVDTTFPVGDATNYNKVTISSGTMTFGKDSSSPTVATTPGTNNVVLATYYAKPTGENMELRKVTLAITEAGTLTNLTGSVAVKVGGAVVYSAAASDISTSSTAPTSITLSTYPTLTAGVNTLVTVEANVSSSADGTDAYQAYLDLTEAKRVITNDLIDPGVAQVQGNSIAVKAAALSVTNLAQPVSASIVPVTNNYEFARFELNASNSGEDVKVTKIIVSNTVTGVATVANVSNLTMWQGTTQLTTTASTAVNAASTTFTFTNPIIVSRTSPVTLSLHGDLVTGSASTTKFHVAAGTDVTAVGKDTGNTISAPTLSGAGQAMTIAGSGSLTLSAISGSNASPSVDQLVKVGTIDGTYLAFQIAAQNEPVKLTTLTLTATGTLSTNDVTNIRLYRKVGNNAVESTPFNSAAQLTVTGGNSGTYTWTATDNLLADAIAPGTPVSIYVKANVGAAGASVVGDSFRFMIASSTTDVIAKGASSNATASVTGTPSATGITYVSPFSVVLTGVSPTVATDAGTGAGITVGVFKVENTGTAQITLTDVTLNDGGSSTSSMTYKLYYSADGGTATDISGGTATTTSANTVAFGASAADVTINGGSYRYLTVKTNAAAVNNNTFTLGSNVLGNLKYSVAESDLGYSANADADLSDTTTGLFIDGKPTLGTVTSKT